MSRVPDLLCRPFCDLARACADRQGFRPAGRRPRHHHQRLLLGLCRHAGPGRMARRSLRGEIRHRCRDRDVVGVHGDDELLMVVGLAHRYSPCLRSHRRRFPAASFKGLAELFDRPERPKLAALLTSSNYAGSMVALLIMAPLIVAMGWRYAFEAIGIAGVAFAVVYVFLVPYVRPAAGPGVEPASIGSG